LKKKSKGRKESTIRHQIENKDRAFVLFYATWCLFSRRFLPLYEEYSKRNPEECLSVIVYDEPDLCEEYSIEFYPTVILFEKGKVRKRLDSLHGVGLSKKQLEEFIEDYPPKAR
jgi:thiol-disulfide isomerase/thioredoxin